MNYISKVSLVISIAACTLLSGCGGNSSSSDTAENSSSEIAETTVAETTVAETTETEPATEEATEPTTAAPDFLSDIPTFDVTSESLGEEWDESMSNTDLGENKSPQLSWSEVEGATVYAAYLIDESAHNFLHMKQGGIETTSLAAGEVSTEETDNGRYIGPYPPSGTHEYVAYVFALSEAPERYIGTVDYSGKSAAEIAEKLDLKPNGESGNVLAYGRLSGNYTKK